LLARPLGSGEDAPIELSSGNLLALLLPTARGRPAARLTTPTVPSDAAAGYAALCARLRDRTESAELVRLRPKGTYGGDVCG
jgi:hypothetical protein